MAAASFQNSKGAPLILARSELDFMHNKVRQRLRHTIARALLQHRGDRVIQSDDEVLDDPEATHLREYREWTVKSDMTIKLPGSTRYMPHMNEYYWHPTEVVSPALWASTESWEEIRAVVRAIRDEYWIMTPPTAGLHYHYGNGKEYIPLRGLRRIAALLLAADPLIVQLHPEHRRNDDLYLSNRLYSRVVHGMTVAALFREQGAEYVETESEEPSPRAWPKPVARLSYERTPDLVVPFRRGELTGYKFDLSRFRETGFKYDADMTTPAAIPFAAQQILRAPDHQTVAELMRVTLDICGRPAYNFRAYSALLYQRESKQGWQNLLHQDKRTVEFRQMASTLDPDEVVAHGKIIVRLCEFAAGADLDSLWEVVLNCAVAETNGEWYDVFDLLAELGLVPEAKVLQHAVARFRGDRVPEKPN